MHPNPSKIRSLHGVGYTIKVSHGWLFWLARVTMIDIFYSERCPRFRAWSEQGARARAERWCERDHARRYPTEPGVYRYVPPRRATLTPTEGRGPTDGE